MKTSTCLATFFNFLSAFAAVEYSTSPYTVPDSLAALLAVNSSGYHYPTGKHPPCKSIKLGLLILAVADITRNIVPKVSIPLPPPPSPVTRVGPSQLTADTASSLSQ